METINESTNHEGEETSGEDHISRHASANIQSKTKTHQRNAMGEYIILPGGKPLTQHAIPLPGPSDYRPKTEISGHSPPHYSIVGRTKLPKAPQNPGAADYNTCRELIWKDKTKTLKEKGRTYPYGLKPNDHETCSLGPAKYSVTYMNTGKHAPKLSVASRHRHGVNVGHPSQLVEPVDTHGFATPGPNNYYPQHRRDFGNGMHKSIGDKQDIKNTTLGPGPAGYTIKDPSDAPAYTLSKRLPAKWQNVIETPAANLYNVGTTIGKGVAMSVRSRQPVLNKIDGPSPNTYTLRDPIIYNDAPVTKVTYRPFEHSLKEWPSPAHYSLTKANLAKAADYSCRNFCKPCFPDVLNYPNKGSCFTPGPGTYHKNKRFTDNDAPSYSMGRRNKPSKNDVPGPNRYVIQLPHRPDALKAPSFSIAKRCFPPLKKESPAPSRYHPSLETNDGPKYSMTKRPKSRKKTSFPASNAYCVKSSQTSKGTFPGSSATLKSRGTSHVYAGYALQASVRLFDA